MYHASNRNDCKFQLAPKESHLEAVKRIFQYLKDTLNFGPWYRKNTYFTLTTYKYVEWERSIDDIKSTSGRTFFLGDCLVYH